MSSAAPPRHHPLIRLLHWLMALLVIAMIVTGCWIVYFDPGDGPLKVQLYHLHESTGMLIWLLVLVRLGVRIVTTAPALPQGTPEAVQVAARLTQIVLYGLLLFQPLIGLSDANAAGAPLHWFGLFQVPWFFGRQPEAVVQDWSDLHWNAALALVALIALHTLGALHHALIRRDGVLRSMWR